MSQGLNIIYAGTPEFAAKALQATLDSEHHVIAVYTQPDRPSGRGQKLKTGAVKEIALQLEIPIYQPEKFSEQACEHVKNLNADLMLVCAYGLLLPAQVLSIPKLGCINIHASLLPRWRGAAPIQRAILAGDETTGISIMQMVESLDAGPILYQTSCDISASDTGATLHDRLAELSASEIAAVLTLIQKNELTAVPQDPNQISYADKIQKQEAQIDWQESAIHIERKIRAFNAWPVAYTHFSGKRLRIWEAEAINKVCTSESGKIISVTKNGIEVATGSGVLKLISVQLAGGKIISAQDFINAQDLQESCFEHEIS